MKKLYLDDIRNPSLKYEKNDWIIVRNYDEFVDYIKTNGLPDQMSLDHDLGEGKTGYDCVKWLVENEYDITNTEIYCHSANPVGKKNILMLIRNYKNFIRNNLVK